MWGACELIEARGFRLLYLPPYSPNFKPIERDWSKIKQLLRSAKARRLDALEAAAAPAFAAIPSDNAAAEFTHCGYGI
jgi:transposase